MARRATEDGIHTIVATPHTLNGIYVNPVDEVIARVSDLEKHLLKDRIQLKLYAGADVHLCPHMLELIEKGEAVTINNGMKYLLLEFPSQTIPRGVEDEVFSLKLNGITPIITHPERNTVIQHDLNILQEFVRIGAMSQIVGMSITGDFGGAAQACAERLLVHRLAHVIASDAHSGERRPPVLSRAVEAAAEIMGSYEDAERMVTEIPSAILSGDVPELPEPKRGR